MITSNIINGLENATASGSSNATYGIYRATGGTPTTISNNTVANVTGSYTLYGIYSALRDASGASAISGNTVHHLTGTGTGSYYVIGIVAKPESGYAGLSSIADNTVHNLSSASININSEAGAVIGISQQANTTDGQTVVHNTVHSLESTATAAVNSGAVLVSGIFYNGPTTGTNLVARKFVHSLKGASTTTTAAINGILAYRGAATYQNNMVRLGIDAAGNSMTTGYAISGIYHGAGADACNFYHNTLWVGGEGVTTSASHTAALNTQTSDARIVKDNILVNARSNATGTGTHAAALFSSTSGLTSDYNLFFAPGTGGALVRAGSTNYTTLSAWQTASSQDANSLVLASALQINLVNPAGDSAAVNLHIQSPTAIEGEGADVGVADDYDGEARSGLTPTDIGADAGAFTPIDTTPPAISFAGAQLPDLIDPTLGNVTITDDITGVDINAGTRPRVYYKRSTDANVLNDNTCNTVGWKYVEANGINGSLFTFALDYGLLSGCTGVDATTVVHYFVVAQDLAVPPNVGIAPTSFASQPASVALTPGAFPVGGTPNSTPAPYVWKGNAVAPADPTDWHVGANWDSGLVPGNHNAALIPLATNKPVVKAGAAEVAYLTVQGSGVLTIDPGYTLTVNRKLVHYGQIKGAGSAIVQDMDWHDGYLDNVQITVNRALVIKSDQWRFLRAGAVLTLASTATATWEGAGSISAFSAASCTTDCTRIENHGVWEIPIDATVSGTYSAGTNSIPAMFHNATNPVAPHGVLKRTQSTGVASLQVCFDNDGTVEVHSGTLKLDGRCNEADSSEGEFLIKTDATLWVTKGAAVPYSHWVGAGGKIKDYSAGDHGNVHFEYGANVVDGEYNISGSTVASSSGSSSHTLNNIVSLGFVNLPAADNNASLTLNGIGRTFDHLYDIENHSGGVLTVNFDVFNVGTLANPKNYTQSCSHGLCTWAGTGLAQVWGTTTWLDGNIKGVNRATDKFVTNGPAIIDNSTWKYLSYRTFQSNAGVTFKGGSIRMTAATFYNSGTGIWDFQCDCDIEEYLNIDSFFENDGVVRKTAGTADDRSQIQAFFVNRNQIQAIAPTGYLDLIGGGQSLSPATIQVLAGNTLGLHAVQVGEETWTISGPLCADPPACAAGNSGKVEVHDSGIATISGPYHAAQGTTVSDCVGSGFTRATLNFDVVPLAMGDLTLEGVVTANFNTGDTVTPDDVLLVNRTNCNPNNNDGRQPRLDISAGASLTVNGAYQQVAESVTYPNLYFAERGGGGHLILNGPSVWSAGTWGIEWYPPTTQGTTSANNTLDVQLDNGHLYLWSHTLNVGAAGVVTIHGAGDASGILSAYYGSAINNQGTITLADDRIINGYSLYNPQTVLNNRGIFRKTSGTGTSGLAAHVNNWGTFAVDSGTLWLGDFDTGTPNNSLLYDLVNKGPADGESASGQVLIADGAQLKVQGFVSNNGKIQQTQSEQAGGGFARQFAMIQNNLGSAIRYQGVDVVPTSGRMETTTVAVWGNQHCGTALPDVAAHLFGNTNKNASFTVLRCYEITPTTPQSADVTFYYLSNNASQPPSHWPNERNGNDDPHAWHHNASANPQRWDMEVRGAKDNITNGYRYVQATSVDQYSPFALLDNSTLAVTLADFSAAQVNDAILVTWETVSELNNRGFNLYRGTSEAGPDIQLNGALIPSQSQGSPSGFIYTWEDRRELTPGTTYYYWLEDVDLAGVVTRHGPVSAVYQTPTAVTLSRLATIPAPDQYESGRWLILALTLALVSAAMRSLRQSRSA
ncbi:MAG TPA: hypothetical protein VL334_09500 [Anaerolineae bacterium]|nr:hypothetical protein [Anaerolineae bacterium]